MTIKVGEKIPEIRLRVMTSEGPKDLPTRDYFDGRKVVLFSVPGAFTPTCSAKHLPGFIEHADQFFERGVDAIGCMAVNDVFVMHAWGKSAGAGRIDMLADGNGEFARALGLELDATGWSMGYRSQRFAMIVTDGIVNQVFVEAPGEFRVSSAEHVLQHL